MNQDFIGVTGIPLMWNKNINLYSISRSSRQSSIEPDSGDDISDHLNNLKPRVKIKVGSDDKKLNDLQSKLKTKSDSLEDKNFKNQIFDEESLDDSLVRNIDTEIEGGEPFFSR